MSSYPDIALVLSRSRVAAEPFGVYVHWLLKNNFCLDFVGECIDIKNATDNKVDSSITKLLVLLVGVS